MKQEDIPYTSPMEACADCHPQYVTDFKATGMGRSLYRPQALAPIEVFGGGRARVIHPKTKVAYRAYVDADGRWWQEESVVGSTNHRRVEVAYVIGSGNHTRSYLGWLENELIQMPLTWYTKKKKWDLSPGYSRSDHLRFKRKVQPPCLFCHNDLSQHRTRTVAQYERPLAEGITCGRCHGDGTAHIEMRQSGKGPPPGGADPSILNPARLTPTRQLQVCQQCHLAGVTRVLESDQVWDRYDPRTPLDDYMSIFAFEGDDGDDFGIAGHGQRLALSRCAREASEPLTCTRCHNPHRRDKSRAQRDACLQCHVPKDCGSIHGLDPKNLCADCHMNRGETRDIPHVNFTDHYIRKRPKQAETNVDRGRSHRLVDLVRGRKDGTHIVANQIRRGLAHYEIWEARGGRIHLGLAERLLSQGLVQAPESSRNWDVLGRTRLALGDYDGSIMAFARVEKQRPHDLLFRFPYSRALKKLGRKDEAIRVLREGTVQAPESKQAWLRLGKALMADRRFPAAHKAISRAGELQPDAPEVWAGLGQLALEEGRFDQAEKAFLHALKLDPSDGRYYFNVAMAALSRGQRETGKTYLEQSLAWAPHIASAYLILSRLSLEAGKPMDARNHLREMMEAAPKDPRSYLAYAELEVQSGEINYARSILIRGSQRLPADQGILDALQKLTPPRSP